MGGRWKKKNIVGNSLLRGGRKRSKIQKANTGIQRTTGVGIMKREISFDV